MVKSKNKRRFKCLILFLLVSLMAFYVIDLLRDRSRIVTVLKRTELYEKYDGTYSNKSTVEYINPEANLKVLRIRYGKDFMSVKVKSNKGKIGWIIYNGHNFSFVK